MVHCIHGYFAESDRDSYNISESTASGCKFNLFNEAIGVIYVCIPCFILWVRDFSIRALKYYVNAISFILSPSFRLIKKPRLQIIVWKQLKKKPLKILPRYCCLLYKLVDMNKNCTLQPISSHVDIKKNDKMISLKRRLDIEICFSNYDVYCQYNSKFYVLL